MTVDDVEFETRYPGKDARAALFDTLARVRSMHRALAAGEPAEDDAALQAEVCRTAAALMVDESVSEDYFAGSEYGVEAALSILFAVEGALTNSAAGAASFRDDA
ncbi:MAG TPA: hypothetical protein VFH78_15660 [Candidatus Thermoplasmatota archaeon]|nr:hypothetical protein [Candidatus Thermoplasmatota archaeon]